MFSSSPPTASLTWELPMPLHCVATACEAISRVRAAGDTAQLLQSLHAATLALGGDDSIYTASLPEGLDTRSFSLFAGDPRLAQVDCPLLPRQGQAWHRGARSFYWFEEEAPVAFEGREESLLRETARRYGFASCLVFPITADAPGGRVEVLCIGSRRQGAFRGPLAAHIGVLGRALVLELHDWLTHHLAKSLVLDAGLSPGDIDLLSMEWQGMQTKDICRRTGLSASTIDCRFARLNLRLNSSGRKASAQLAAACGLFAMRY